MITSAAVASRQDAAATTRRLKALHDVVEVPRRDLAPWRKGNTGVDYVTRFDSGRKGPTILINGLTHGNEPCGLEAIIHLFEAGFRPKVGSLILSIANVEAYAADDIDGMPGRRFLDDNLSRLWTDAALTGSSAREARRARELLPFVTESDVVLDIHSTPYNPTPFIPMRPGAKRAALADALGHPRTRVLIPADMLGGDNMTEYGRLDDETAAAVGLTPECGLHYARASVDVAISIVWRLLARFALADAGEAARHITWSDNRPRRDFTMTHKAFSKTGSVRYLFEPADYRIFPAGAVVAWDGEEPIVAPYDDCCPLWVPKRVEKGGTALIFTRAQTLPDQ